ncbi:hypothetical protein P4S68_12620 [Pseudoalteromonas sp. Hal099]
MARLFNALFDSGVVLVATSNAKPEQLIAMACNARGFYPQSI